MSLAKVRGDRGEAEVARYLRRKGCTLLASQWRCRFGEIDLVARDRRGTLLFVEVKLRSGDLAGLPREAVDNRKQEKLRQSIRELEESVAYIDWKQNFYDEVLSGQRPYESNLIRK